MTSFQTSVARCQAKNEGSGRASASARRSWSSLRQGMSNRSGHSSRKGNLHGSFYAYSIIAQPLLTCLRFSLCVSKWEVPFFWLLLLAKRGNRKPNHLEESSWHATRSCLWSFRADSAATCHRAQYPSSRASCQRLSTCRGLDPPFFKCLSEKAAKHE